MMRRKRLSRSMLVLATLLSGCAEQPGATAPLPVPSFSVPPFEETPATRPTAADVKREINSRETTARKTSPTKALDPGDQRTATTARAEAPTSASGNLNESFSKPQSGGVRVVFLKEPPS